jgi:hypothetical protein
MYGNAAHVPSLPTVNVKLSGEAIEVAMVRFASLGRAKDGRQSWWKTSLNLSTSSLHWRRRDRLRIRIEIPTCHHRGRSHDASARSLLNVDDHREVCNSNLVSLNHLLVPYAIRIAL